ncbi:MAG TPA: hypothetical protein VF974_04870 [Patescibacteria group bacterium]
MFNLTYKSCDIMKKTKDTLTSQLTTVEKTDLVARIATMGVTHIAISVVMDDNARLISVGSTTPSPRTVESETQDWCSIIHAQPNVYGSGTYGGFLKVIHRGAFCGIENIWGFPFDTGTALGTAASSAADGNTTWCGRYYRYLNNHVGTRVATGDVFAPIPEGTTNAFGANFFTNQAGYMSLFPQLNTITSTYATAQNVTLTFMSHNNFSEAASGWLASSLFSNQSMVGADYYGQRRGALFNKPSDYVNDWAQLYLGKDWDGIGNNGCAGVNQFWGEWGDLPNAMSTSAALTEENRLAFLIQFYKSLRDSLVSPNGHLVGFNNWGGWEGQNTSLLYKDSDGKYQLNARGKILQSFFINNGGTTRVPVVTAGTAIDSYTY